ncbi:hypothetical protein C8J56DRAFT_1026265 [Mycena floridula]|nr:hypothetical protein C8J56DRAFT_1026265 [Mycena floridula]
MAKRPCSPLSSSGSNSSDTEEEQMDLTDNPTSTTSAGDVADTKSVLDGLVSKASASRPSREDALRETAKGLRGKDKKKAKGKAGSKPDKKKPHKEEKSHRPVRELDDTAQVGQVYILACGVELKAGLRGKSKSTKISHSSYVIADDSARNFVQVQELADHGLAKIDHEEGLRFRGTDTYPQFDSRLRNWLPKFFEEVDKKPRRRNPDYVPGQDDASLEYFPGYILLAKTGRKLSIVPSSAFPNGSKVMMNIRDGSKKGFKDRSIILCSVEPFPIDEVSDYEDDDNDSQAELSDYEETCKRSKYSPPMTRASSSARHAAEPETTPPAPSASQVQLENSLDLAWDTMNAMGPVPHIL